MRFSDLENTRVAILGAGREGQAVWRQFCRRFPDKPVSIFAESAIDDGFAQLLRSGVDTCHSGPFDVASLKQFDVLVRSAGISPYRQELQQLRSMGLRFTTASNLWFAENPDAKTICISGTMGKSTTAALTAHLLTSAGFRTRLAGNIGKPMLDCENGDNDWWVIELSSYQISDLEAEPGIALLLNLSDEHVDWHGGVEQYAEDKLKLARLAGPGRMISNYQDPVLVERLAQQPGMNWFNHVDTWRSCEGGVIGPNEKYVTAPAALPGRHNMHNLAAVLTLLDKLGIEIPRLDGALASFAGLPHRLQFIGEKVGVRYINDSISTTPVSVSAALQTIGNHGVVLLLGGMDRGLDWGAFVAGLAGQLPHAIITLPDNGPIIFECLEKAGIRLGGGLHQAANLMAAVALAQKLVPEKGCVLLSPGAPSFPHFKDFEDRGNQFKVYAGIEKSTSSAH
jgi:UDP-N-acetylmuramoylalanine--D-glutamate ligase